MSIREVTFDQVSLADLMSGIQDVYNEDGFPLESTPPQGEIQIIFGNRTRTRISGNSDDYQKAIDEIASRCNQFEMQKNQFRELNTDLRKVLSIRDYEYFSELEKLRAICKEIAIESDGMGLPRTLASYIAGMRRVLDQLDDYKSA